MRELQRRLGSLEAKASPPSPSRWHRITVRRGSTEDQALSAYGRSRVGPSDSIAFRLVVAPGDVEIKEAGK